MANRLSSYLSGALAKPAVNQRAHEVVFSSGPITTSVLAADSDGIIFPVYSVPSHARVVAVIVGNDAITGGTDYNFGIYNSGDWNSADQAVRDVDIYVDGISMAAARDELIDPAQVLAGSIGSMLNVLGQGAGAITGLQYARQVWEDAGLSAAPTPGTMFDLCWTAPTVGSGAGTIRTTILYTVGV
jgi:hypothetical protein